MPKSSFKVGDLIEVTIERLSYKFGKGVCRFNDFVFFIGFTAPGDKVKAKITQLKKNYGDADLVEVLEASPHRRTPLCPVAQECGGCQLQQVTYQEQLRQKQSILEHQFKKFSINEFKPIAGSSEYYYRNRIQLHTLKGQVGYLKNQTHSLIPINECFIADKSINAAIRGITAHSPRLERYEISVGRDQNVNITHGKSNRSQALFSQVNNEINEKLKNEVLRISQLSAFEKIFDLYCGQGNFTELLGSAFPTAHIVGVEYSQGNVALATKFNKLESVEYIAADVAKYLASLNSLNNNSLFVLDPPRAGCDQSAINEVLRLLPAEIIYISCDLATLSRDLERLSPQYQIHSLQGFDMFPQTGHIEALVHLRRNS